MACAGEVGDIGVCIRRSSCTERLRSGYNEGMDPTSWDEFSDAQRRNRVGSVIAAIATEARAVRDGRQDGQVHPRYAEATSLGRWLGHAVTLAGDAAPRAPRSFLLGGPGIWQASPDHNITTKDGARAILRLGVALWSALEVASPGRWDAQRADVVSQELAADALDRLDAIYREDDGLQWAMSDLGSAICTLVDSQASGSDPAAQDLVNRTIAECLTESLATVVATIVSGDVPAPTSLRRKPGGSWDPPDRPTEVYWRYAPFAETVRPSMLRFVLDPDEHEYERPIDLDEWTPSQLSEWDLALGEIADVIEAGPRRGGVFEYPEGAGPASDALMAIYEHIDSNARLALHLCKRRVGEVPEELDAWCTMSGLYLDFGQPEAALQAALTGVQIGEAALPDGYSGVAIYGLLANRPFLRSLGAAGVAADALGRKALAERLFTTMLWLDVYDHAGARFNLHTSRGGTSGEPPTFLPPNRQVEREQRRATQQARQVFAREVDAAILRALNRNAGAMRYGDLYDLVRKAAAGAGSRQVAGRLRALRPRGLVTSRYPEDRADKNLVWCTAAADGDEGPIAPEVEV